MGRLALSCDWSADYDVSMDEQVRKPSVDTRANRMVALIIALACAAPLVVAATLTPSDSGMGTHTQMGLPDCGFKMLTGYPCATCGCTTAFAHAAHGSLLDSFITQPFGAVLAVSLAMVTIVSIWSVLTGMSMAGLGAVLATRRAILFWAFLLLAAWAYKAASVYASG